MCQMIAMCNYVNHCAGIQKAEAKAKQYIDTRLASADQAQSAQAQLVRLRRALENEQNSAARLYRFPELNSELYIIVDVIAACIPAIQEIQNVRRSSFAVEDLIRYEALGTRMARDQMLNPPHPQRRRATAADAVFILPVLHEATLGHSPNEKITRLYRENNTQRDKLRLLEKKTVAKLRGMVENFDKIIPGFMERIETENLKEMSKSPLTVPISPDTQEILWLARLHSACIQSGDKPGFIDAAQTILRMMTVFNSQRS